MGDGMLKSIPRVAVLAIVALVAACGGGGGGKTSPTPPAAVTLTSLAPAAVNAGTGATVLTATGSGFTTASVIEWNGAVLATSYVSSTSLTATIPAADFMEPGSVPVTVSNAASGGATSDVVDFTVSAQTAPTVATLAPASVTAGGPAFVLVVNGTNFLPAASVLWNGSPLQTSFQSSTVLTASVTASQIVSAGTASVSVLNDSASGGTSNAATFTIAPELPVPTLVSLSPTSIRQNQGNVTLTLTGTNFTSTTQVAAFGGVTALSTAYVSSTQLTVSFTASGASPAAGSTLSVSVTDPASGNRTSNALPLQVTPAFPVITSISPSSVFVNQGSFALTVTGQFFSPTSVVYVNGSARPTSLNNGQLVAQLTALDVSMIGTATITVEDSVSGSVASNSAVLNIYAVPTLAMTSIWPQSVPAGNGAFTLTVTGSGFTGTSVIQWNGAALTTAHGSVTTLSALVPATDVASVGTAQVTVAEPAIAGDVSSAQTLSIVAPSIDAVSYQINNGHSGSINFQSVLLPTAAAWTVNVGGTPSYAVIASNRVFVVATNNDSSQLYALDAATGASLWGPIPYAGPAGITYDNGTLFVNSGVYTTTGTLTALDAATGNVKWSVTIPGQWATEWPPVASEGIVYMLDTGELTAFNESDGTVLWHNFVKGTDGSIAVTVDGVYMSSPCTAVDFQPAFGTSQWSLDSGCTDGGGLTPTVSGGRVYAPTTVTGYDGDIYDAESGAAAGVFNYASSPAVTATNAYGVVNSTLQSVSLSTSQVNWSFAGDGTLITSPIVVNNYVFVGSTSGNLYGLDATTGNLVWSQNTGGAAPATYVYPFQGPTGLSAGDGLLVVPAGNTVTAYVLSTNP